MKVDDYLYQITEIPELSESVLIALFSRRFDAAQGFLAVEERRGFIRQGVDFSTSQGQDMLRLLFFRVIEETWESLDSTETNHRYEEVIDAINFLWEAFLLEYKVTPILEPSESVKAFAKMIVRRYPVLQFLSPRIGYISQELAQISETFRNRSWQNQTQDIYFAGRKIFMEKMVNVSIELIQVFPNWETFYKFFVAKDEVLRYRIRSKY